MIPRDLQIATLVLGAVLFLAALLYGVFLKGAARTAPGKLLRAAIAVGGIALMAGALASYLRAGRPPAAAPPAVPAASVSLSARDLVRTAGAALEACPLPTAPAVPDSARASRAQMDEARRAFAAYDAATNAYTQCVDTTIARTAQQFAGVASESDLQALNNFGGNAHDAAIDQEKAVVDQFNAQVRAYNTKHPK